MEDFSYSKYSQSFGPEGRGVKYIYEYVNDAGQVYDRYEQWEVRQQGSIFDKSKIGRHGFFYGEGAKTTVGPRFDVISTANKYGWLISPIDGADAIAKEHDLNQESIGSFNWLEDFRTLRGDLQAIEAWEEFIAVYDGTGKIDPFTGREASREALTAASFGSKFFGILVRYKQWKIAKMESLTLDPNNSDDMRRVTVDAYRGKWYQFKRNIEQKILKNASDAPK